MLLVTAADDTGRVATLRQAAGHCGVQARAWVEAEQSSLLSVEGDVVAVKHPLVRSAVYQAATSLERRQAHRALADALSDDPDRATWHRAAAADGPDEGLAGALGLAGARAEQRGGYVAAAAAYERAAELTIDEAARAARLFAAARNAWASGQAIRARALAMLARELADDALLRADIERLRGRIEVNVGSATDAHRIFMQAARAVVGQDPVRALEMAVAATLMRSYGADSGTPLYADTLTVAVEAGDTTRTRCLKHLLAAMTLAGNGAWGDAVAALRPALAIGHEIEDLDLLGNLGNAALNLGDDEASRRFYTHDADRRPRARRRHVGRVRAATTGIPSVARWPVDGAAQLRRRGAHPGPRRRPASAHRGTTGVADPARGAPGHEPTTRTCSQTSRRL